MQLAFGLHMPRQHRMPRLEPDLGSDRAAIAQARDIARGYDGLLGRIVASYLVVQPGIVT